MRPSLTIAIDGKPVAGAFYERLVSATITDKEGEAADTIDIELNDGPPDFLAIPRKGAIMAVTLGVDGQAQLTGRFTVDKVKVSCLPFSMSISGKSADLRDGKLKARQERHWDDAKLGDVVSEIARESGLTEAIDPEIAQFRYAGWLGQQDETNIHFLQRLAHRHDALFAIKDGRLIFAKRGSGQSASGRFVGSVVLGPGKILRDSCSFEANDRTRYSKVVAYYQDSEKATRREIEADGDADGDSVFRLPEPFASVEEADKAAQAKAKALKRGEGAVTVKVSGDPGICAGAPLIFEGVRPGLDGVPYVIDTATHSYTKGGYLTEISAKLYDGKSAKASGAGGAESPATTPDKVAPNAPAGTPATPSQWTQQRRSGLTDAN